MLFPTRRGKYVLYLEISGFIPKTKGIQDIISRRASFLDILEALVRRGRDAVGVFADISSSNLSLSEVWEIKKAIELVKRYGVRTVAFLRGGGIPEVFLADAFDKVYAQENASFFLVGFSSTLITFGEFFKKIRVKLEGIKSGRLKSIPDLLTKSEVPEDVKEEVKRIISDTYEVLATETKRFSSEVFLSGIVSAKSLVMEGVFDAATNLPTHDLIHKEFGNVAIEYPKKPIQLVNLRKGKTIAVLNMFGIISDNPSPNFINLSRFGGAINKIAEDRNIEGVIVRVNSRGGDAVTSDIIRERLKRIFSRKNAVLTISSIGASGGYLISLASPKIFATPFSVIGSIGVFLIRPYIGKLLSSIGIGTETIEKGKLSSIFSPYRELSRAEKKALENLVIEEHNKFIKVVSESRKIPEDKVKKIADGSVFVGKKAKDLGLIDAIKSLSELIEEVGDSQQIEEYPKVTLLDIVRFGSYFFSDAPAAKGFMVEDSDVRFLTGVLAGGCRMIGYVPPIVLF